ncbi:probable DNA-directed RNA polymerase subunit delta [Drosophila miranda]|uniref:probable DNA-directed RNA polymerase subunit delta n=1 Tax=Drosophila miranda TaxID=7229 RepID=UPI0007E669C9|nr:probable DNA-directed RNA polymerase subunit delta [Drosophila miranda]
MRALMVFALLAFLAVSFVAARPAEDEETADLDNDAQEEEDEPVDDEDTDTVSNGDVEEDSQDSDDEEPSADDAEDEESTGDDDARDDDDNEEAPTVSAPNKRSTPFWPRFGGRGPVLIHARPRYLSVV